MSPRARNTFLAIFLTSQIALPLRYYLRAEAPGSTYDERFAWRMFSPVRMIRCKAVYEHDGAPVELSEEIHSAWGTLLQRGRPHVVDAVSRHLCREKGPTLTLELTCRELGDKRVQLEAGHIDLCTGKGIP